MLCVWRPYAVAPEVFGVARLWRDWQGCDRVSRRQNGRCRARQHAGMSYLGTSPTAVEREMTKPVTGDHKESKR
jgi:hypothetical protein